MQKREGEINNYCSNSKYVIMYYNPPFNKDNAEYIQGSEIEIYGYCEMQQAAYNRWMGGTMVLNLYNGVTQVSRTISGCRLSFFLQYQGIVSDKIQVRALFMNSP